MKILLVNTSEWNGGAAVAANRLLHGLLKQSIEATMLVCDKQSEETHVLRLQGKFRYKMNFVLERAIIFLTNSFSRKQLFKVSIANTGFDITQLHAFKEADIIHLHWVNQGMLSLKNLEAIKQSGKPVVWTMHDMWPMTGICHHAYGCERFTAHCGQCPFLGSARSTDASSKVLETKKKLFLNWPVTMVAVSTWLASLGTRSAVLRGHNVEVIPNAIPLDVFKPLDKEAAIQRLNLPKGKILLVFGAAMIDYPVKGFSFVKESLSLLGNKMDTSTLHVVLYGGIKSGSQYLSDMPVSYTWLGKVAEDTLPVIFSACDILVAPSYYETFGQTLIEAQSCGCIPVCFGNSGQTDIVEHGITGLFASYLSAESLADTLYEAMTTFDKISFAEKASIAVRTTFSDQCVTSRYIDVYERMLATKSGM